jgi:N-acetylmuramoyl-L-alanine amidase
MRILLDNGHGKDTKGTRSPNWENAEQLFEWEFNRDIVDQIDAILQAEKYDSVVLVPEMNDVSIKERVRRANKLHSEKKSILISVHGNGAANNDSRPHGVETFYFSNSGKVLANELQNEVVGLTGWRDRGVRKAYDKVTTKEGKEITIYKIAILRYTKMVAVLTENGFYTNFEQCKQMMDDEVRTTIALAHVKAIKQYIYKLNSKL